jgi:hypothetical protein
LIVYDESKIKGIEIESKDAPDGEARVLKEFQFLDQQMLTAVTNKLNLNWQELRKVYLDFFFVPVKSIDNFRTSFSVNLWGPNAKTKKKRTRKQKKTRGRKREKAK